MLHLIQHRIVYMLQSETHPWPSRPREASQALNFSENRSNLDVGGASSTASFTNVEISGSFSFDWKDPDERSTGFAILER